MEEEIEDKLQEIYKNIKIEVKYEYLRTYRIYLSYKTDIAEIKKDIILVYDAHLTFDGNINIIVAKIDRIILSYYKKGE